MCRGWSSSTSRRAIAPEPRTMTLWPPKRRHWMRGPAALPAPVGGGAAEQLLHDVGGELGVTVDRKGSRFHGGSPTPSLWGAATDINKCRRPLSTCQAGPAGRHGHVLNEAPFCAV